MPSHQGPHAAQFDSSAERFARRVFFWAGIYGVLVLPPHFFLESQIGRVFPPAITHPENFYGFISVALVWQIAFLAIARQPVRFLPLMPLAVMEKCLPSAFVLALIMMERAPMHLGLFAALDILIGGAFLISFLRLSKAFLEEVP